MAKPPPLEYFEVTVRCPKELLGDLMTDINKRGLQDVKFDLVTAVPTFRRNAEYSNHHTKAEAFLEEWIKDHPTFRAIEAIKHFKADGRTPGAGYTALRVLSADGRLNKLGEGMYSVPGVKALPAPKKVKAAKKRQHHPDVPAGEFTLRLMSRAHGKISSGTLKSHFAKDGRAPTGVGPVLRKLMAAKKIKQLGEGMYELMLKKSERPTNGAAVVDAATSGV